jgi:hypothetical protein
LAANTGNFVTTGQTGVFALAANTGNFVTTGQTGKFASLNGSNYLTSTQIPNITGDVCINAGTNISTVYKIQGYPISNTAPTIGQTLQFDGSYWQPGALPAGGNGGGGLIYYFNADISPDNPITNLPTGKFEVKELGRVASAGLTTFISDTLSIGSYTLIAEFVTDILDPGSNSIPAGLFDFNFWATSNAAAADETAVQFKIFKYDGSSVPTLLSTSDDTYIYDPSIITQYTTSVVVPQTNISLTDRIYIQILGIATKSNKTISLKFGNNSPTHLHTTIPSVGGSGLVKVINGVMQNPATLLVDADISASAAIAGNKIQTNYFALASATGSFVTTVQTGTLSWSGHVHANYVTTGSTGAFALAANTGNFVTTSQTGDFLSTGAGSVTLSAVEEKITVYSSVGASALINFDTISSSSMYYTQNSTADFYLNLRGSSSCSFNSLLDVNKTLTTTFFNTNGSTAYALTGISVDGTNRAVKWLNSTGSYPTGNINSIDAYSITAVKTGDNLYTIFGSQGRFA